jgi:hypothetical protein
MVNFIVQFLSTINPLFTNKYFEYSTYKREGRQKLKSYQN